METKKKAVEVREVRIVGMMAKQPIMRVDIPEMPSQEQIKSIEYAIEHILKGRQVVLSGTEIEAAPVLPGFVSGADYNIASYVREVKQLKRTIEERETDYEKLKKEKERLQAIIDGVDKAFMDVSHNSTRGKLREAHLKSRFGGA